MISKTFRIARMIVLASFALSSAAWAATYSNASLSGTYAWLHGGTASDGTPVIGVSQVTFDSTTGTKLAVNDSGDGVISGRIASTEDGTILTFAEEPVTGSYTVDPDCRGRATITPKGHPEMHFDFVVVDGGNEMLALETDADTGCQRYSAEWQ
jgi:hypothetical protein